MSDKMLKRAQAACRAERDATWLWRAEGRRQTRNSRTDAERLLWMTKDWQHRSCDQTQRKRNWRVLPKIVGSNKVGCQHRERKDQMFDELAEVASAVPLDPHEEKSQEKKRKINWKKRKTSKKKSRVSERSSNEARNLMPEIDENREMQRTMKWNENKHQINQESKKIRGKNKSERCIEHFQ